MASVPDCMHQRLTHVFRRAASCPPGTPVRPPLRRQPASADLTSVLHLINIVDSSNVNVVKSKANMPPADETFRAPVVPKACANVDKVSAPSRPIRHSRMFSFSRRKHPFGSTKMTSVVPVKAIKRPRPAGYSTTLPYDLDNSIWELTDRLYQS